MAQPRGREPEPEHEPLRLGDALRPIVLGRGASPSAPGIELRRPELSLGVAPDGYLLGYALIDQTRPPPLGGLTSAPGQSLDAAQTLMTSASLQLALYGVRRPAHHCVLLVDPDDTPTAVYARLALFVDALRPLLDADLCRLVYVRDEQRVSPPLALRSLVATSGGATLSALEHAGIRVRGATLALHQAGEPARLLADQLVRRGMHLVADGDGALRAGADVLLVDGPVWRLDPRRAATLRARVIVALGPLLGSDSVEARLAERSILVVPDTLAATGLLLGSHLLGEGYGEDAAIGRCFTLARALTADVLARAAGQSVPVFARSLAREALRARDEAAAARPGR